MYHALYRKYRPLTFDDVVGQDSIVTTLRNSIINKTFSHAYMFFGPRGTGKTSTAKIIARMINCSNLSNDGVPCGCCESCLNFNSNSDIVEIQYKISKKRIHFAKYPHMHFWQRVQEAFIGTENED